MKLETIIFITDKYSDYKEFSLKNKDGEGNSIAAMEEMMSFLNRYSQNVICCTNINDFYNAIELYPKAFVVSTYYGEAAPNSKTLIPAICESKKMDYFGADSYAHTICNDKYLSKLLLKKFNLQTSPSVILYNLNEHEFEELKYLHYPVIVKPNFGGGSNGIMNQNIQYNYNDTVNFVKKLYTYQELPILVEELIPGYEVSVILAGTKDKVEFHQEVQIILDEKEYFQNEIFGLESKKIDTSFKKIRVSSMISNEILEKMKNVFCSFNKMVFMRIDCRVNEKGVYVIELSPDCYIGTTGAFYKGFASHGYSFQQMMDYLFTLNSYQ